MEKGIVLVGEAAQAYVQYKYVELFWLGGIVILFCCAMIFFMFKAMRD